MAILCRFTPAQIEAAASRLNLYKSEAQELAAEAALHWASHGNVNLLSAGSSFLSLYKSGKGVPDYVREFYLNMVKLKVFERAEGKFLSVQNKALARLVQSWLLDGADTQPHMNRFIIVKARLIEMGYIIEKEETAPQLEQSKDIKTALKLCPSTVKGFEGLSPQVVAALKGVWLAATGEPWSEGSVKRVKAIN